MSEIIPPATGWPDATRERPDLHVESISRAERPPAGERSGPRPSTDPRHMCIGTGPAPPWQPWIDATLFSRISQTDTRHASVFSRERKIGF
jgi:hypothetical protein